MHSQILVTVRVLGAIFLSGLALLCGFGFLASFEPGFGKFPNVFHALYGGTGVAAVVGAALLVYSAVKSIYGRSSRSSDLTNRGRQG
jgi:hypothetical protein